MADEKKKKKLFELGPMEQVLIVMAVMVFGQYSHSHELMSSILTGTRS